MSSSLRARAREFRAGFSLFDFARPLEPGEALRQRIVELIVVVECCWANVGWARYIEHVETIVHPLGIAVHVPLQFMLDGRVPWFNAWLITVLLGLGFARRVRWAYAAALGFMLFQYGARYSIGEIPHGANLIGMCLLGFGLGPLLFAERQQADRFAGGFIWVSITVGYVSAACCKLGVSGPRWVLGEYLSLSIYNKTIDAFAKTGHYELSVLNQFLVDHRWAATLFGCGGLLTELSSLFVLHRRLRPWALGGLVVLHLGIGFILQIWFRSATLVLVVLALPPAVFTWSAAAARSRAPASARTTS